MTTRAVVLNLRAADRHQFVGQHLPGRTERTHYNLHYFHFIILPDSE